MLPDQRRSLGMVLMSIGIMAIFASVFVMYLGHADRAKAASQFSESAEQCKARLVGLGGTVEDSGGQIVWTKKDLSQAPARLGEASVAAVSCPGWKLSSSCMGEQCPDKDTMRIMLQQIYVPEE